MSPLEVALRFIVSWLTVGLGIFIATGALAGMRSAAAVSSARVSRRAYVVPFLFALALCAIGIAGVARTVPW